MIKKVYKQINETVYKCKLENGMNVVLLYKKGFLQKDAYIITEFGHFDSVRKIEINGKKVSIPDGSAHFLEHRLFYVNGKDASDLFNDLGATCNAYTTYEKTAYYFSTISNFYECLSVLLDMMRDFSSTDEQIENEKSIIIQEANMNKEEPASCLNKKIYENSYANHPIRKDIIGTYDSIMQTNKEQLKAIFDTFYDPSNLTLVVCGDIDHNELERFLSSRLLKRKNENKIKKLKINEPSNVIKQYDEISLKTINTPRLAMLYKLKTPLSLKEKDKMYFSYNFLIEYLFASSGKLSEKWLKEGIVTTLIDYSISSNIDLDNIIFYNITNDVDKVINAIKKVFDKSFDFSMTNEALENLKKSHYGATLRSYESVGELCSYYVYDLFTSYNDFFEEIEEVKKITLEDIKKAYYNICEAECSIVVLRGE